MEAEACLPDQLRPWQDFKGKRVNVVQIGLGTFGTFVQNLAGDECDGCIKWLLEACSERCPESVSGVAVEPVAEHIDHLRIVARRLPNLELVQAAIGQDDVKDGLYFLSSATHKALLGCVPLWQRKALEEDLIYVRNMSCVGSKHPAMDRLNEYFDRAYGLTVPTEHTRINVWTYDRLSRELNFCGCEVLLIDAEGHDVQILRSMVLHCQYEEQRGRDAWPDVVQFETMGHCDCLEGIGAEANMIEQLKGCGYILVYWSYHNSVLIHNKDQVSRPDAVQRLKTWMRTFHCNGCNGRHAVLPFITSAGGIYCWRCYSSWRERS